MGLETLILAATLLSTPCITVTPQTPETRHTAQGVVQRLQTAEHSIHFGTGTECTDFFFLSHEEYVERLAGVSEARRSTILPAIPRVYADREQLYVDMFQRTHGLFRTLQEADSVRTPKGVLRGEQKDEYVKGIVGSEGYAFPSLNEVYINTDEVRVQRELFETRKGCEASGYKVTVMQHEYGHIRGLPHLTVPDTMMSYDLSCEAIQRPRITPIQQRILNAP